MKALKMASAGAAVSALVLGTGTAGAQQNVRTATSWAGGVHLEQFAQGFSRQAEPSQNRKRLSQPLMRPVRFERTTHSLEGCCSIQLSYGRRSALA